MRSLLVASLIALSMPPHQTAASTTEGADVSLRIASLNAWLLPLASSSLTSRKAKLPKALAERAPDIVCLQEVWLDGHQKELARAMRGELPYAAHGHGGLMVLSRYPIGRTSFHPFPHHADLELQEALANKGWLEVDVRTPAGPLRVVNSHLALDRSARREAHAAQLKALVGNLGAPRHPLVLCADLNLAARHGGKPSDGYEELLDAGLVASDPPPRAPTRLGWPPRTDGRGWSPDYILVRGGGGVEIAVRRFARALTTAATALSDHVLLLADLTLSRTSDE